MKASAYKQYGDAAVMALVLEALPQVYKSKLNMKYRYSNFEQIFKFRTQVNILYSNILQIAAEVAAPLAKTDEIVLLGGADRTTSEINKLVSQLPPAVSALTGVDLSGVSYV